MQPGMFLALSAVFERVRNAFPGFRHMLKHSFVFGVLHLPRHAAAFRYFVSGLLCGQPVRRSFGLRRSFGQSVTPSLRLTWP